MKTTYIFINDDSRNTSLIEGNSIHLIVVSSPYWQLKDYAIKQ
ncbi:MAG: hypothetical protein ACTTJH_03470 [Bacteroidales bacterium]